MSLLDNKTVLCPKIWKLKFFWKIGLDNSKILLEKFYFLAVKKKLSKGHVIKMPSPKVDIKEHSKLRDPKNCHVQDIGFLVFLWNIGLFSLIFPSGLQQVYGHRTWYITLFYMVCTFWTPSGSQKHPIK